MWCVCFFVWTLSILFEQVDVLAALRQILIPPTYTTCHPYHHKGQPQHQELHRLLFSKLIVSGFFINVSLTELMEDDMEIIWEMGPMVYCPCQRRLEHLTIKFCRLMKLQTKGSLFSSVTCTSRSWVLIQPGLEPTISCTAARYSWNHSLNFSSFVITLIKIFIFLCPQRKQNPSKTLLERGIHVCLFFINYLSPTLCDVEILLKLNLI